MTNHIDQLAQWWDSAEESVMRKGDTVIQDRRDYEGGFDVFPATTDMSEGECYISHYRILSRASKPRPAWRDAVAVVIARIERQEVYAKLPGRETWKNAATRHELSTHMIEHYAPVPLIEARVTDETVSRIEDAVIRYGICDNEGLPIPETALLALANAALGITPDTEETA